MSCNSKSSFDWVYFKLNLTSQNSNDELRLDELTWKRWLKTALRNSHGLFGESIEYSFLYRDNSIAYVRVGRKDKDTFLVACSTYISNDDLMEYPLVMVVMQETKDLRLLQVQEDDKLWLNRCIEEEEQDQNC